MNLKAFDDRVAAIREALRAEQALTDFEATIRDLRSKLDRASGEAVLELLRQKTALELKRTYFEHEAANAVRELADDLEPFFDGLGSIRTKAGAVRAEKAAILKQIEDAEKAKAVASPTA